MKTKLEEYFIKNKNWKKELELLRTLMSDLPLEETIKWGAPTYVFNKKKHSGLGSF